MVKTPKTRHSKSRRDPVTIDLEPVEVSRTPEDEALKATADEQPEAAAEQAMRAEDADFEPWEHDESAAMAATDPDRQEAAPSTPAEEPAAEADRDGDQGEPLPTRPMEETTSGRRDDKDTTGAFAAAAPGPGQPKRGMNGILAGLIGGVIALAGAGGLQYAGILPGGGAALDGVNNDIASLKTSIAALTDSQNGGEASARVNALSGALDLVKADIADLKSSVQSAAQTTTDDNAALTALDDKVTALERALTAVKQQDKAAPVDLGPLDEKLAALAALVKSSGEAGTEQASRLAALEQSVSQMSGKVEAQAAQPKIALAIAASALKSALDRSAPFSTELETFAAISPDAPQIAALRAFAQKGVPARSEIAAETDAAANAMVAAARPENEDAGFIDRLLSSAESLVKVRPIGAVQGAGVPETVARMEAAVQQGDYAKALSEYETLPEPAKAAGADFAAKLKARLDAEAQIDALIAGAMQG